MIHPTAIVDPTAELDSSVEVGPYATIEANVRIGAGSKLLTHAFVGEGTILGENNEIHMGAVIGHHPQHRGWEGVSGATQIGNDNIFREYVTIHRSWKADQHTIIGDDNLFMALSHVGHDSVVGSHCNIANNCLFSGHVVLGDGIFASGGAGVHQFVSIGDMAMLGAYSRNKKDVPPYALIWGDGEVTAINMVALKRSGVSAEGRSAVKKAYHLLYHSGLNVSQALEEIKKLPSQPEVDKLIDFIESSKRGICPWKKSGSPKEEAQTDGND
ncbi:acyl-ACP--UDP-N-acetylglucosamine O-acyltransferase [Candidatus Hydrogenedentota bacterium]